ncbi:MAG: hypothetical protein MZV70_03220 [Desulfobacterales bacterium]|nr:hypothetical protein [Desulfobacterales bacterium]
MGAAPLAIILYQQADGDRYTIYLTETDACLKCTGAGETFSYITDTYTTGTITSVDGDGGSRERHGVLYGGRGGWRPVHP